MCELDKFFVLNFELKIKISEGLGATLPPTYRSPVRHPKNLFTLSLIVGKNVRARKRLKAMVFSQRVSICCESESSKHFEARKTLLFHPLWKIFANA